MPSFRNFRWRYLYKEKQPPTQLVKRYGRFLAQLLVNRGFSDLPGGKKVEIRLKGLNEAYETLERYIKKDLPILIFGDYDVDGLTSTTIFYKLLKEIGAKRVIPIVPERSEGYGLSPKIVEKFAHYSNGRGLIVTLDNGTKEVETVKRAKELGLEVVIFDHHTPGELTPDAVVVNPKLWEDSPQYLKDLSTVGLVFLFALYLEKLGYKVYAKKFLDLVALGTVADVSPLSELNYKLVKKGLKLLSENRTSSLGLYLMVKNLHKEGNISENDLAFKFVPRLNAFGRMESARKGLQFLLSQSPEKARYLFKEMEELNSKRRRLTREITRRIVRKYADNPPTVGVVCFSPKIAKGISGIIAGRLSSIWGIPAVVFASDGEKAVGSARSPKGVNIVKILEKLSPLLERWGGHAQAAGLTVKAERLEEFKEAFLYELEHCSWEPPELFIDLPLQPLQLKKLPKIVELLKKLEPYGVGNPYPTFVFDDRLVNFKRTPYGYKLHFERNGSYYINLDGEREIPPAAKGRKVRVVYTVRNLDRLEISVEDFAFLN